MTLVRPTATGKRSRSSRMLPHEDEDHSDEDRPTDDSAVRPAQAERKRELERNRRNLVNVRFTELEAELRRCAPRVDGSTGPSTADATAAKCRRIDKEAVLKEAAQRLAVQRKEIAAAVERISNMTTEIDNLRAEKVELRSDKSYLRDELETVRGDVQRLRSDNINLWQALKKQSSIKNVLSNDVAKLPAELFLRPKNQDQSPSVSASVGLLNAQSGGLSTLVRQPPSFQPVAMQNQVSGQQDSSRNTDSQQSPRVSSDAFLVFQSAEELGELFSSYVPGSVPPMGRQSPSLPANPVGQRRQAAEAVEQPNSNGFSALTAIPTDQATFGYDVQQPHAIQTGKPPDNVQQSGLQQSDAPESMRKEKPEEDPFSDIAYCV